jgi:hypothetical protein
MDTRTTRSTRARRWLAPTSAFLLLVGCLCAGRASAQGFTSNFESINWLHPPLISRSGRNPDPGQGDIFVDAQNSIQSGPMIISPQGQLIWFHPLSGDGAARDVEVQRYQGQTVLTFWQGYDHSFGVGRDMILNHEYQTIGSVVAGNGFATDDHAFEITPQGTALIAAYAAVHADLSAVGGPRDGTMVDCAVQEIDIKTGKVLWQWDARDHVGLRDSYAGKPGKGLYDPYHLNSVQQLPNGNVLISIRDTWAVYEIDKSTGKIVWSLGGKHSSFKLGRGADFEWQHDAEMLPDGTISVFDDGAALTSDGLKETERNSRALRIRLHPKARRATLVRAFGNKPALLAESQGSVQVLSDGNTFVGWGSQPYFSEFAPGGRELFSLRFPFPLQSYRAYRFRWWGQPQTSPSIARRPTRNGIRLFASWNGATGVASWRVLAGASQTALATVETVRRRGFETTMWVPSVAPYVAVQALGPSGQLLGTSSTLPR